MLTIPLRLLATAALLSPWPLVATACSPDEPQQTPPPAARVELIPIPVPVPLPLTFPMPIEVAIADQRDAYTQNKLNLAPLDHFSILGRDEVTGDLGFATVANLPAIGSLISAARAKVGVAMVGAKGHMGWKTDALDLLAQGKSPDEVIAEVAPPLATENLPRQLAVLSADGRSACFNGIGVAGGGYRTYSVSRPNCIAVCSEIDENAPKLVAMLDAFEASAGFPLPERLILSLRAGWNTVAPESTPSADTQFRQRPKLPGAASASMLVVRDKAGYDHRSDVLLDLRVDLSRDPLPRLTEIYHAWCWAVLGPRLPALLKELAPGTKAYELNQRWLQRARQRTKIGEE